MKQLLALLLFGWMNAAAQPPLKPVVLIPEADSELQKIALPFRAIKVLDVRFDRSNIGCIVRDNSKDGLRQQKTVAVFPDSFALFLPGVLNQFISLNRQSTDTLLLLVKQFRLSDYLVNAMNRAMEPSSLLKLSASFFTLRDGNMTKLFSVDETLSESWMQDKQLKKEFVKASREEALASLLHRVFSNRHWSAAGNSFSMAGVTEGIARRYALPVLTDTSMTAGVYASFAEFKANKPSITAVKFNYRKGSVESVQDEKGNRILLRNIWGVCDGRKRYIVFHGELCTLVPSDKSFRFYSYTQTSDLATQPGYGDNASQNGLLGAALLQATNNTVNRQYFFLNMDEEEVYLEEIFGKSKLSKMHRDILK